MQGNQAEYLQDLATRAAWPIADLLEVPTRMDGIEINTRLQSRAWRLVPDLTKDTYIHCTHELLAQDIEAIR